MSTEKKQQIFEEISALLQQLFDVDADAIQLESKLYEELDLDSIDAVDMVVHLQKKTAVKIQPDMFKAVRTVQDVVDVVESLMSEPA